MSSSDYDELANQARKQSNADGEKLALFGSDAAVRYGTWITSVSCCRRDFEFCRDFVFCRDDQQALAADFRTDDDRL